MSKSPKFSPKRIPSLYEKELPIVISPKRISVGSPKKYSIPKAKSPLRPKLPLCNPSETYLIRNKFRVSLLNNIAYIKTIEDDTFIEPIPYVKVFMGNDNDLHKGDSRYFNKTILLETEPLKYVLIGDSIKEFKTKEKIQVYESPMYEYNTVYPYAYTSNYTILLHDDVYFFTKGGKHPEEVYIDLIKRKQKIYKVEVIHEDSYNKIFYKK